MTEGERVRLMVRSADGVHGIEIKRFKVNKPVPRGGKPVQIDFVASGPGHLRDPVFRVLWRGARSHGRHARRSGQGQLAEALRRCPLTDVFSSPCANDTCGFGLASVMFVIMTVGCDESLREFAGPTPDLQPTFSSIQRDIFNATDSAGRLACTSCHNRPGWR